MEEAGDIIIVMDDDDGAESCGSDNGEDSNNEHENNEINDSRQDSSSEEADMSSNDDEVDTFCNSERFGESDDETPNIENTRQDSPSVQPCEYTKVEVNVESTPKRKDLAQERRPQSSNSTPQSSSKAGKKHKGKQKAGNPKGKNPHTQGQGCTLQSKNNCRNWKTTDLKNSSSEGYKNYQIPSQQNSPYPKNSSSNKGGGDQNWKNKSSNNFNQNVNKSNNFNNASGGNNTSCGNNSKGQNNKSNNSNNSNNKNNSGNNYNNNNSNNSNNKNNNNSNNQKKSSENYSIISKGILKEAKDVVKSILKKNICGQPLDSPTLSLHYRLSVLLFILLYTIVQGCWIWKEAIICIDAFNANAEVPYRIKNFCLSYPFVEEDFLDSDEGVKQRRYILFYRWTHHSFLIIASVFYIPRILAKTRDNPRLKQLLHDLALGEHRYDSSTWQQDINIMLKYINNHGNTHGYLYFWFIMCHLLALAIDCSVVLYLDYMLQGRFMNLVYSAFLNHRDPRYFKDELSRTFPPFVRCMVEQHIYIHNERTDWFGCHLLLMDIYDKMFVVIWLWLVFLIMVTVITLLALILLIIPPFNRLFLMIHTDSKYAKKLRNKIVRKYNVTDLFVLHLMKRHRSETEFVMLMSGLVNSEDPCDKMMELKLKKSKVGFKDEATSNGNYQPEVPPSFGKEKWSMDSTCQLSPGLFTFKEAIRNRKVDSSTPNPKCDLDIFS